MTTEPIYWVIGLVKVMAIFALMPALTWLVEWEERKRKQWMDRNR